MAPGHEEAPAHKKPQSREGADDTEPGCQHGDHGCGVLCPGSGGAFIQKPPAGLHLGVSRSLPGRQGGEGVFQVAAATQAKA